ncbi:ribokinase [Bacillus sp. SA1-12]|nr:ribokinase [Bacillus sp. SA1-12]
MDFVIHTPRAPKNGETIIGSSFSRFPGGKGANQAVAAARLGGYVTMIGKLGLDQFGEEFIDTLKKEKINTQFILQDEQYATGVGFVTLEKNGDNRIVVVPGANMNYKIDDLNNIENLIKEAKILLVQLEMDLDMIQKAVSYAAENQVPVILNPAPAPIQRLDSNLLKHVTYLTPNETELEILTGIKVISNEDAEAGARLLIGKGVKNVVVTLADKGSLLVNQSGTKYIPGFPVNPVDSVAAGDAFNGALAVGSMNGKSLIEVIQFANAVGALTVTKKGAIPSLPSIKEVENFIKDFENRAAIK